MGAVPSRLVSPRPTFIPAIKKTLPNFTPLPPMTVFFNVGSLKCSEVSHESSPALLLRRRADVCEPLSCPCILNVCEPLPISVHPQFKLPDRPADSHVHVSAFNVNIISTSIFVISSLNAVNCGRAEGQHRAAGRAPDSVGTTE
jgi:hypothetical protein